MPASLRPAAVVVAIAVVAIATRLALHGTVLDAPHLEACLAHLGPWVPLALGAGAALGNLLFLPTWPFQFAAGTLLGLKLGLLAVQPGIWAGAMVAFLLGKKRVAEQTRMAAELGDGQAFIAAHGDVIDAVPPAQDALDGLGDQHLTEPHRAEKGDKTMLRHGAPVAGVAGEGEGAVGQRKNKPAMASAVPVDHVGADGHGEARETRGDRLKRHAERLTRPVVAPHRLGAGARQIVGPAHQVRPEKRGGRFSRKARAPSA